MFKIYNEDCMIVLDRMIKENYKVDFSFTSPPYNRERNDKYNNYQDKKDDYYSFLKNIIDKNLKISKYLFLNIQKNYYNKQDVFRIIGDYSDKIIDIISWTKSNPMPANGFNITNSWELIIILSDEEKSIKAKKTYTKNHIHTSVYSENPYKKIHRAVMKPEVVDWFIERFTSENDTILDCFMGLGTTGISALNNKRNFVGIELSSEYYNIAKKRLEELENNKTN